MTRKKKTSMSEARESMLSAETSKLHRITGLTPLARDPNMRELSVDGRRIAVIRAVDAEDLGLQIDQPWTQSLAKRLAEVVETHRVRKLALSLLGRRSYSRAQLIDRLMRRTKDQPLAHRIADEAKENGWLNDEVLAEDIVRSVTRSGQVGSRLLKQKLHSKGVAASAIERVMSKRAVVDENQAAWELVRKRIVKMSVLTPQTMMRRLAGLLNRRGFDDEAIEYAMERLQLLIDQESVVKRQQ